MPTRLAPGKTLSYSRRLRNVSMVVWVLHGFRALGLGEKPKAHGLVARGLAKCGGRRCEMLREERGEMTLARAPDLKGHVGEAHLSARQQSHGLAQPAADDVLMGRHPGDQLETAREPERIQAYGLRDLIPPELGIQIRIHILHGAPQGPGSHLAARPQRFTAALLRA